MLPMEHSEALGIFMSLHLEALTIREPAATSAPRCYASHALNPVGCGRPGVCRVQRMHHRVQRDLVGLFLAQDLQV